MTIQKLKDKVVYYKRDIIFVVVGVILVVILVIVFFNAIGFLVGSLNTALDVDSVHADPVRFNITDLEALGIGEDPIE